MIGRRFGRLVVLKRAENVGDRVRWIVECDCGNRAVRASHDLRCGDTRSCGCLRREVTVARSTRHGAAGRGGSTPEYRSWAHARERCLNPKCDDYKNYGGRGITMCDRWARDFKAFLADMGTRPRGSELDRRNNLGNYEPGNCRWTDHQTQSNNRRSNRRLLFAGRDLTVTEWARQIGFGASTLLRRLDRGWTVERTLTTGRPNPPRE